MKALLEDPILFSCGLVMKNRFMLAPLTNSQSFEDGQLSDDEYDWLTMRAKGQFGLVMTCASHVQECGKGFNGQLGVFSDKHINGHKRLTQKIKSYGSLALIQLHHAGMRSPTELIKQTPVCPSINEKYGARALSLDEINQLKNDFISAAKRAKESGYDGIQIHGAHGYILAQFLSSDINKRTDNYGGTLENRARILFEIVDGIRDVCGDKFLIGVRLSPEKFGQNILEIQEICMRFIDENKIDFLDISLWDIYKYPEEIKFQEKTLLSYFTDLDYKKVRLTVAGKIRNGEDVKNALDSGIDFVTIGNSAILHHDFPVRVIKDINFKSIETPVSREYLRNEGLGERFIYYLSNKPNYVY